MAMVGVASRAVMLAMDGETQAAAGSGAGLCCVWWLWLCWWLDDPFLQRGSKY
jgi:hypothetical protein